MPKVDGERRMGAGENRYEVSLEGLYRPFCLVGSFSVWGNEFVLYIMRDEVLPQAFRCFVVHDLELDIMPELIKPLVSARVSVDDGGFAAAR